MSSQESSVVLHHAEDEADGDGLHSNIAAVKSSNHPLHSPEEGPKPQLGGFAVFFFQLLQDAVDGTIRDDADDGVVQGRPSMGAVVWLARFAAVALDFVPFGEALDAVVVQHFGDFVVVGLVVCY